LGFSKVDRESIERVPFYFDFDMGEIQSPFHKLYIPDTTNQPFYHDLASL
jgi:hypothetical protein